MKRLFLGFFCLVFLVFGACSSKETGQLPPPQGDRAEFEQFLTEIQPKEELWTPEELQAFQSYRQPEKYEHIFSEEEIHNLEKYRGTPKTVTGQEAADDVTLAFRLMSYGYGGYQYFGGDEVFLPIRNSILAQLESVPTIKTEDLWKLLWDSLSPIIIDYHFYITTNQSETSVREREYRQSPYFVQDLYFNDPTGIDSQYVKRTIAPSGALTYCLATVCKDPAGLPATMTIEGVEHQLSWQLAQSITHPAFKLLTFFSETTAANGHLPVLQSFAFQGTESKIEKFIATGSSYKKKPLFVLDLRGNVGGNSTYARSWLENFCGKQISEKNLWSIKLSTYHTGIYGGSVNPSGGGWLFGRSDGTPWETDNLIFVLIDNNTGSSGEIFANLLDMGKRVVLVGTNTAGCLNFGNVGEVFLPNSGIRLQFGTSCSFTDSLEKTEGIGYFPDLWVEPEDSLDAVVRLCNYYGLYEGNQ